MRVTLQCEFTHSAVMATARVDADLTVCSICFEEFKRPKYLPCLHSFCELCIAKYLASAFEKIGDHAVGIECPICRKTVEKPHDVTTADEWAKQLPVNHLLVSMMDITNFGNKPKVCVSCQKLGKTESATSWCATCRHGLCETCIVLHDIFTQSERHKIVKMSEVDASDPQILCAYVPCVRHPEKKIEAYCFDHRAPCCMTCVMIEHRKCEKVDDAESVANEFRKSSIYSDLEKDFVDIRGRLDVLSMDQRENIETFMIQASDIKSDVKKLRKQLNDHLDDMEANIEEELAAVEKENIPKMEAIDSSVKGDIKRVHTALGVLRVCSKYASNEQLLVETEKLRAHRDEMKGVVDGLEEARANVELTFVANETLSDFKSKVSSFGKLDVNTKPVNVDLKTAVPVLIRRLKVDGSVKSITGCVMVDNERLVIATGDKETVELHSIQGMISSIALKDTVWGVDMINESEGVATRSTKCEVVFFKINGDTIDLTNSVKITKSLSLYDIHHASGKILVSTFEMIKVMDLSGNILDTISQPVSSWILHLNSVDSGHILYTNRKKVFCISQNGKHVFAYSSPDLDSPEDIGADADGNVYVIGNKSRNVHQITSDGKWHRILLSDLSRGPSSFHFFRRSKRFCISIGNTLYVYEMRKP